MIDLLRFDKISVSKSGAEFEIARPETYRIWSWFGEVGIDIEVGLGRDDEVMG